MKLRIDYSKVTGVIKPMNAVNNGPIYVKHPSQDIGNLDTYTAANIPFARTHDASFCARYGGSHTVDVHLIFPDFDADPYAPESYDFALTDEYLATIMLAGTQVFYRLGSKIEHEFKKYGTLPPKDFKKWAVICEHIIAHMNEGWADGHHMGIRYWEIWNEPDLIGECWGGTKEQFFELYAITAKHLKEKFPSLMIGGPAVTCYHEDWLIPFFDKLRAENVPLDFYSWHCYTTDPKVIAANIGIHRALLDRYGFCKTENILNEWNYVCGWVADDWKRSIKTMIGMKGAAFIAAVMSVSQPEPLDILMYYDARPCAMNGLFSTYTYETLKGYYPIKTWGGMLKNGVCVEISCDIPDIYAAAATSDEGECAMITYYTDDDSAVAKTFTVEIAGSERDEHRLYLLDDNHDMEDTGTLYTDGGRAMLTMLPNTVVVIK